MFSLASNGCTHVITETLTPCQRRTCQPGTNMTDTISLCTGQTPISSTPFTSLPFSALQPASYQLSLFWFYLTRLEIFGHFSNGQKVNVSWSIWLSVTVPSIWHTLRTTSIYWSRETTCIRSRSVSSTG